MQYTTDVLFRDLWLRPGLAPRDWSLVTVSALIASGQAKIPYHLNRAMDNGLTQTEAAEVITHLAFYVGWPNDAFSALPVAKEVFDKRQQFFKDSTKPAWRELKWGNKIAAGFTNSGAQNGDKLSPLVSMALFAAQHAMIWVGLDLNLVFAEAGGDSELRP
jgi:alkylhydroperoxidase/carboxymuconolactone decarboxylase family protein YurZ